MLQWEAELGKEKRGRVCEGKRQKEGERKSQGPYSFVREKEAPKRMPVCLPAICLSLPVSLFPQLEPLQIIPLSAHLLLTESLGWALSRFSYSHTISVPYQGIQYYRKCTRYCLTCKTS